MKRFRQIIRAVLLTLLLLAVGLPAATYLVLATPWAQEYARTEANRQLSALLGSEVRIDGVDYRPFNTITLRGIHIADPAGHPALEAVAISARFELWHFVRTGRMVVDYAVIDAPALNLYRSTPDAPLNVQPLLDRLKSKEPDKPPTAFDLKIGTAIVRRGRLTYNVLSEPCRSKGFDAAHVAVSDLEVYGYVRHVTESEYDILLESLSMKEQSGLHITDLSADVHATPGRLELQSLRLRMPASDIAFKPAGLDIDGYAGINKAMHDSGIALSTDGECHLALRDLAWAVPVLESSDRVLDFDFKVDLSLDAAHIHRLRLADNRGLGVNAEASARGFAHPDSLRFGLRSLHISVSGAEAAALSAPFSADAALYLRRCGDITLDASAEGTLRDMEADLTLYAAGGSLHAAGRLLRPEGSDRMSAQGSVSTDALNAGRILGRADLAAVTLSAEGSADFGGGAPAEASADVTVNSVGFRGYTYRDIRLSGAVESHHALVNIESADSLANFSLMADASDAWATRTLTLDADIHAVAPHMLGLASEKMNYLISGTIEADLHGTGINDLTGYAALKQVNFSPAKGSGLDALTIKSIRAEASEPQGGRRTLTLASDFLSGTIEGVINPSTLGRTLTDMAAHTVPALLGHDEKLHSSGILLSHANDFTYSFELANAEELSRFLHLPVQIIYPVTIDGSVSSTAGTAYALVDAPFLQQGDKIIESTVVQASISASNDRADLYATTRFPTKKGPMTAVVDVSGADNRFDTDIDWNIDRKIPLNGRINFSTEVSRGDEGKLCADTRFNPGQITFGDDVWAIAPSSVIWCDGLLTVRDFSLTAGSQSIAADGVAGPGPDNRLSVRLADIELAAIFETLEIDKALIGGRATGTFNASQLLSKLPVLTTDDLHVTGIGYNYCTLGDADVRARFDNDNQAFELDADIINPEGQHSRIWGKIFAASESLDLNFDARHIKVGFMKPFMEAFASDVQGYVSGQARLFGTFKNIDMDADIFAEDLRLKIDFTNTWYTATDSIHVRPGLIDLKDITIRDVEGHTAMLNGWLRHDFFHNPTFDFRVSGARDFLSYNVTPKINPDWYGTVYGNGSARIQGKPGVVEIGVNMSTAPRSTFTFVLSDQLEAEQYSFISFRDRTEVQITDTILAVPDDIPAAVKEFQARMMAQNADEPSDYLMDIKVDITPEAQMIIVMDPVGGDRIKASGSGDLRMTYDSADNDLRMYGTYTLDRGSYNFTLQDIIIKDFTIDPGSSITFRGDPYSAQLDIDAVYSVNANLSDLDESFLQDKDLNRTNVPVQALLKVTGDMRQPDIAFDLRFPTLTSDIYRKVRSIISTEEMMNRQIIYLLALNRFYTPDYMTATRGSELFSVASSTISSQLSSMLGKLSDNWSIAPNLRSDRGDFSDVEVDLALSSRLLNNRLLFNGNFGYRDRSLNTNQFIGDFDIEYLLNPRGTWRLKAYNRYNDQNYYVRTAATTQGVGIMFRRDFDSLLSWLRRKPKMATEQPDSVKPDTTTHSR